jgi:hypothetical protein
LNQLAKQLAIGLRRSSVAATRGASTSPMATSPPAAAARRIRIIEFVRSELFNR